MDQGIMEWTRVRRSESRNNGGKGGEVDQGIMDGKKEKLIKDQIFQSIIHVLIISKGTRYSKDKGINFAKRSRL